MTVITVEINIEIRIGLSAWMLPRKIEIARVRPIKRKASI